MYKYLYILVLSLLKRGHPFWSLSINRFPLHIHLNLTSFLLLIEKKNIKLYDDGTKSQAQVCMNVVLKCRFLYACYV